MVLKTSGQSNLTKGRIAAAYRRFSCIRQVVPMCTPPKPAFLGPLESIIQTTYPSIQPFLGDLCQNVSPYAMRPLNMSWLSVLSVLSVTLVYCGQTVGWIKMKLCMSVGLGHGHIVLYGIQLPLPQRGTAPNFRPMSVAKRLDGSRWHLAWGWALVQATLC